MADSLPVTPSELVDVIAGMLAENGPMTKDQLAVALADRGVDLGDDPGEVLGEALEDSDEPVMMLTEHKEYQRLADGSPVRVVLTPFDTDVLTERDIPLDVVGQHRALLLPPGYLREASLGEGDVIALGVAGDGLMLEVVPE